MENTFDPSWGIKDYQLEDNIRGLRNMGIDIPDCHSVQEYRDALKTLLNTYANVPGKLRLIYSELRHGVNGAEGTSYQQKICMASVANRLMMNYTFLNMEKEEINKRKELYERLFTITVLSKFNSTSIKCSNCAFLDNKNYSLLEDFVIGYDSEKKGLQNITISLPLEISEAMEGCINREGCHLLLG